jgi:hypothetical protein
MGSKIEKKQAMNTSFEYNWEKNYIKENLQYFIESEKKISRSVLGDMWFIHEDRETLLRSLLTDYIIEHFSLDELYLIFFCQDGFGLEPETILEARQNAIENINNDASFTPEEAKQLKRKVWDIDPILFGLILELIHQSSLFYDCETEKFVLPTFN